MTFAILFNTINYTFWITRFYQLTFFCHTKQKKSLSRKLIRNKLLALYNMDMSFRHKYKWRASSHAPHKDKYCFPYYKKNNRQLTPVIVIVSYSLIDI